ncbi:hypothetical protein GGD89_003452 [Roseospira visakhapatnamensis]|uniref:Uncharacterized protein n=1 Tax=Roseospira visakhapatnamensis TaxID=390880 RepID=A0A7W6RG39_9PROT|nr:hypothetical protein [Roseospira visakhapatnamensis]
MMRHLVTQYYRHLCDLLDPNAGNPE